MVGGSGFGLSPGSSMGTGRKQEVRTLKKASAKTVGRGLCPGLVRAREKGKQNPALPANMAPARTLNSWFNKQRVNGGKVPSHLLPKP